MDYVCSALLNAKHANLISYIVHILSARFASKTLLSMVDSVIEAAVLASAFQLSTRSAKLALIPTASTVPPMSILAQDAILCLQFQMEPAYVSLILCRSMQYWD